MCQLGSPSAAVAEVVEAVSEAQLDHAEATIEKQPAHVSMDLRDQGWSKLVNPRSWSNLQEFMLQRVTHNTSMAGHVGLAARSEKLCVCPPRACVSVSASFAGLSIHSDTTWEVRHSPIGVSIWLVRISCMGNPPVHAKFTSCQRLLSTISASDSVKPDVISEHAGLTHRAMYVFHVRAVRGGG